MDLGFETIGNACLICHDGGPQLVTDPWIEGPAYFGSWTLSHEVPAEQREAIRACRYIWLSHGHPDHLSPDSLALLRGKPILIGDHYGARIAQGLRAEGWEVRILETGAWTPLSARLRVMCVPDYSQDSMLLLDFDGRLVIDANDAGDRGVGDMLRGSIAGFRRTFLACLTGYGDADMINVYDETGRRILPGAAAKAPVGPGIAEILRAYGIQTFVPSSSMHTYQRADSVWANEYRTEIDEHALGFDADDKEILPAFVRYDLLRDQYTEIRPRENPDRALAPEECGDDWEEELEAGEAAEIERYFRRVVHLRDKLGFIALRVGGRTHRIALDPRRPELGLTFEVPRRSLMTCIRHGVFDDLLIGNFMKTTLHGGWENPGAEALYPHFTPFVTKYGDNGGSYTPAELRDYARFYVARGFSGPGPSPATQTAWAALSAYL